MKQSRKCQRHLKNIMSSRKLIFWKSRGLSSYECLLFLQWLWVWFLACMLGSSLWPIPPAPGDPVTSSGLHRIHMHIPIHRHTHIIKKCFKRSLSMEFVTVNLATHTFSPLKETSSKMNWILLIYDNKTKSYWKKITLIRQRIFKSKNCWMFLLLYTLAQI